MRRKLKCGGKPRKKALFGIDGAAMAAATIAAAGMNVAATAAAAKQQANAMIQNAKTQGQAIMDQTRASNEMTREQIATQRQINKENQNSLQPLSVHQILHLSCPPFEVMYKSKNLNTHSNNYVGFLIPQQKIPNIPYC